MIQEIFKSFNNAVKLITEFTSDEKNIQKTLDISFLIAEALKQGKKVLICGNGGSMADADHFAEEFIGRFRKNRKALPAISLSNSSYLSCVSNDFGFKKVFYRGVEAFGEAGDILIVLSTSGNSQNILLALQKAKIEHLTTVGLLGKDGGKAKEFTDIEFIINGKTSDRIQEVHMTILHIIIEGVERILFPNLYFEKETKEK
jgi:D-sedoheptulose 7-phosphate isomerase